MQLVLERENPQPGGGITGLSYAGAAGEAVLGEGLINHAKISKMLFGRVRVFCGLTPELSRTARSEPVGAEAAKRSRLERIVRPSLLESDGLDNFAGRDCGLLPGNATQAGDKQSRGRRERARPRRSGRLPAKDEDVSIAALGQKLARHSLEVAKKPHEDFNPLLTLVAWPNA